MVHRFMFKLIWLNLELKPFFNFFVEWIVERSNSNNFIKVIMVALMKGGQLTKEELL
jgi:hypothetical protein